MTPWTLAHQAPVPMGFSRQEYWSELPCPPPGDLPDPEIEPASLTSPAMQAGSSPLVPPGKPHQSLKYLKGRRHLKGTFRSVLFSSVAQLCPTLCDPMNRSTPGLPVHHQLPEFTQTHVHRVADAIQLSRPLSSVISSSVVPFSSCPQSLPASESFPMSQFFT